MQNISVSRREIEVGSALAASAESYGMACRAMADAARRLTSAEGDVPSEVMFDALRAACYSTRLEYVRCLSEYHSGLPPRKATRQRRG